jgi:GTP-sensing pleiotropic transcriptional regulator CodY
MEVNLFGHLNHLVQRVLLYLHPLKMNLMNYKAKMVIEVAAYVVQKDRKHLDLEVSEFINIFWSVASFQTRKRAIEYMKYLAPFVESNFI